MKSCFRKRKYSVWFWCRGDTRFWLKNTIIHRHQCLAVFQKQFLNQASLSHDFAKYNIYNKALVSVYIKCVLLFISFYAKWGLESFYILITGQNVLIVTTFNIYRTPPKLDFDTESLFTFYLQRKETHYLTKAKVVDVFWVNATI